MKSSRARLQAWSNCWISESTPFLEEGFLEQSDLVVTTELARRDQNVLHAEFDEGASEGYGCGTGEEAFSIITA
jgi:hypothetical protein